MIIYDVVLVLHLYDIAL